MEKFYFSTKVWYQFADSELIKGFVGLGENRTQEPRIEPNRRVYRLRYHVLIERAKEKGIGLWGFKDLPLTRFPQYVNLFAVVNVGDSNRSTYR